MSKIKPILYRNNSDSSITFYEYQNSICSKDKSSKLYLDKKIPDYKIKNIMKLLRDALKEEHGKIK